MSGVSVFELCSRSRARHVVAARRLAVLTWSVYLNRPSSEIARALGLVSSSAAGLISSAGPELHQRAADMAALLQREARGERSTDASSFAGARKQGVSEKPRTVP
jgi:hypothetical protein